MPTKISTASLSLAAGADILAVMNLLIPPKLKFGDEVRVIAPSRSLGIISKETRAIADKRFAEMGLDLTFSRHAEEMDAFASSSIASRLDDLHAAFDDQHVKCVITSIGGFNSNQLLPELKWDIIRENPKIFCGFSDITALSNAMLAKTGLVTYSGPHYSSFGMAQHFDYTLEYFKRCLLSDEPFNVHPSAAWSDDEWYKDQQNRQQYQNTGWTVIRPGQARGTIWGGNLSTLGLLSGTEYMPQITGSILFIEDDYESQPHHFDRQLTALLQQPGFDRVSGIVIGRFQRASNMADNLLHQIIASKHELEHLPVIANLDFGHTTPTITIPIGGECEMLAGANPRLAFTSH